jgi:ABC-type Fe3+/spermidine/putrescine transport system ATPase subunit
MMRKGRVVQAGAATDVWRSPTDEWTADFLGFGPAVDGAARSDGIATPWGVLPVAAPADGRVAVRVVLRPDAARLDPSGPVRGRVTSRAFAGDHTELTVIAGGVPLRIRAAERCAPEVGDTVNLAIDAECVLVYPVN